MAKKRKNLSVSDLEQLLEQRFTQLESLVEKRKKLLADFAALNQEFEQLAGGAAGGAKGKSAAASAINATSKPKRKRRRARNSVSLASAVKEVLSKNKKGLSTADIEAAVLATGFKTTSKNFRPMIYQSLGKLRDNKEVVYDQKAKIYKITK